MRAGRIKYGVNERDAMWFVATDTKSPLNKKSFREIKYTIILKYYMPLLKM